MSQGIPIITPPVDDPTLGEWLSRMTVMINAALLQSDNLNPIGQMPGVWQNGMIRYFSAAIAPHITVPGFWGFEEGTWIKLG